MANLRLYTFYIGLLFLAAITFSIFNSHFERKWNNVKEKEELKISEFTFLADWEKKNITTCEAPCVFTYEGEWGDSSCDDCRYQSGMNFVDAFTLGQLKNGAIILHVLAVLYMFIGLSVVCDDYFVPALELMKDNWDISHDVAGATLMAAGGSVPELFTAFIGVFVQDSAVGFGTIVGSAVFNVLFVIGVCAMLSPTPLNLTWWPLFRDVSYYSFGLVMLAVFFAGSTNGQIDVWESLLLLIFYVMYVILMKYNQVLHKYIVNNILSKNKNTTESESADLTKADETKEESKEEEDQLDDENYSGFVFIPHKQRPTLLQMCVTNESIDTLSRFIVATLPGDLDQSFDFVDTDSNGSISRDELASVLSKLNVKHTEEELDKWWSDLDTDHSGEISKAEFKVWYDSSEAKILEQLKKAFDAVDSDKSGLIDEFELHNLLLAFGIKKDQEVMDTMKIIDKDGDKKMDFREFVEWYRKSDQWDLHLTSISERSGINIDWPVGWKNFTLQVILLPLTLCLYFTIPDVRKFKWRKYFILTFFLSILWVAIFSYLMVWWATEIGDIAGIPPQVMGLTFIAMGTSVPDLLTSVIVAKAGHGDMAVSSSIGSNIFDILIGLPLPWFFYSLANGKSKEVSGNPAIPIIILLGMLIFIVSATASQKWRMTKKMGLFYFFLYGIYVLQELLRDPDIGVF